MKKILALVLALGALVACGHGNGENAISEIREIKPVEIKENPIELWGRPVVTAYVSSSRYTHDFMEKNGNFTVTFFPEEQRGALQYLGSHSGRDGDKIAESGLTLEWLESGLPSFAEADMIIEARKIYGAPFDSNGFGDVPSRLYASGRMGVHSVYVGEIEHVWVRGREGE